MRRKLLLILLLGVCFIAVFVIAIFLTLPTDSIRHFAEKMLEKQLKQEQSVEIEDLSISPLLNVTVKNFQMRPRNPEPVPENLRTAGGEFNGYYCAPYVDQAPVIIDKAFVNPSIFKSIKGKPEGSFELNIQDGEIFGDIKNQDGATELNVNGQNISLNEFPLLSNFTKMQIHGGLEFDVRAVLEKKNLSELKMNLNSSMTALCPTRIKLDMGGMPFFELPFTVFGNIVADIEMDGDKVIINTLTSDGPDIVLDVTGDVIMKSGRNPNPRLNISAVIKPSESWVTENDMKAIYKLCEKHDDGSVHLKVTGTTKKPKMDCGTPIPEPVPDIEVPEKKVDDGDKGSDKKRGAGRQESTDEKDKPEPEPVAVEHERTPEPEIKGPSRAIDPNGVMRPERRQPADGGVRNELPSGRRAQRPSSVRGEGGMRRIDAINDSLDENIEREVRRRNRGRMPSDGYN